MRKSSLPRIHAGAGSKMLRPGRSRTAPENNVSDYVKEGQVVRVKVLETDERGKIRLSMKALLNENAG